MINQQIQLALPEQVGECHGRGPGLQNPEVEDQPLRRVGGTQPDMIAWFDSHFQKRGGDSVGAAIEFSIADLFARLADDGPVRKEECRAFKVFG